MRVPYIGSGPYCYSNSLAMLMGPDAPPPSAIEVLTGAPFGFHVGDGPAWFDPLGWNPNLGLDTAVDLLGWTCDRTSGGSAADALARLRDADGPVFVGPVEFGLLLHHPGSGAVLESDHFMVVTGVTDGVVHFHDPHGFPFATLPVDEFAAAWESVSFEYPAEPFTMRAGFRRVREVAVADALRACLPVARRLLSPDGESPAAAVERFAGQVAAGLTPPAGGAPRPLRGPRRGAPPRRRRGVVRMARPRRRRRGRRAAGAARRRAAVPAGPGRQGASDRAARPPCTDLRGAGRRTRRRRSSIPLTSGSFG